MPAIPVVLEHVCGSGPRPRFIFLAVAGVIEGDSTTNRNPGHGPLSMNLESALCSAGFSPASIATNVGLKADLQKLSQGLATKGTRGRRPGVAAAAPFDDTSSAVVLRRPQKPDLRRGSGEGVQARSGQAAPTGEAGANRG